MRRIVLCSFVMVFVTGAIFSQSPAPSSNFQNIGTMSQLMQRIIYPTSNDIFYIERKPPQTDYEWGLVEQSALTLAESGNLLMLPGRARDEDKWIKDSKLLVDVGAAAYKAARDKDLGAVLALNDQLNTACITCHQDYRPNYGRRRQPN
jgi:hypothetical protein